MPKREVNPGEVPGKRRKPMQTSPDDDEAQVIDQSHLVRHEERDWVPPEEKKGDDEAPTS